MTETHFVQLREAALAQPERQRLLFVFAAATLGSDADAAQRARFAAGEGGELDPVMCVDKDPSALTTFADLAAEAAAMEQGWQIVFVAGLPGQGDTPPSQTRTDQALAMMVESVRHGDVGRFAAYDVAGEPVRFH